MAANDPKDDVDRLFACFKCGVSPPPSAFRERPRRAGKRSRAASAADGGGGGSSSSTPAPPDVVEKHGVPSSAVIKFTGRKQMSPVVFYGSPQGVPVKKPLSLLQLLREIRIDLKKQTDLVPSTGVWATFPRQEEAIRFSKAHDHTRVFSYQDHLSGQRRFLFSRHLIIRIPKTAFKDNSHVGAFISEICSRIASQRVANPNFDRLYITKDGSCTEPADHLFMDTAVYSRNRCFRLAFSSKSGKKSFLVATERFKHKNMNDKELFMESLICRLDDDCDKLLTCKLDLDCQKTLHFDSEASVLRIQGRNNKDSIGTYRSDFPLSNTYGKSPFPALDGFIESIASFGNVSACQGVGTVSILEESIKAIMRGAYYQKCYDPDCQGYRSPLRPVPWDVIPEISSITDSAQREYQGEVVEINIAGSNRNEYISNGDEDDPSWWDEAIKFADSIENTNHAPGTCDQDNDFDDADWWMDAERIMVQIEEQIGSQSNA
uniref:DNA-directed primase/polymerase protein n=1 Tax=Leersia perrieri TaxID=77586 RepID=A0A0D9WYM6_9ORYZ